MEIVRRIRSMKEICRQARENGRKIGFVPTMGSLHEGHLSLMRRVKELADVVVVSVFVNPSQFNSPDDFASYPRDPTGDADLCIAEGVDYLFMPSADEMYPPGSQTHVEVYDLSRVLEGESRPGHFRGVTTVLTKLFEIVRPTLVGMGQKDAQQAAVVKRMVSDLMMDLEVLVLPTVRDADGVALSSRNRVLTPDARQAATAIPRALDAARAAVDSGEREAVAIIAAARAVLEAEPRLEIDHVQLVVAESFAPVVEVAGEMLLLAAVKAGGVRLIDNTLLRG
jgi:pantoate--beta-alanine ligase